MNAEQILTALNTPHHNYDSLRKRITISTSRAELLDALTRSQGLIARNILIYVVVDRCETAAVPVLVTWLDSEDTKIKQSAAEGLEKLGEAGTGAILFAYLMDTGKSLGIRGALIGGLGTTGYRPAIPLLTALLGDPEPAIRGAAAWSLSIMGASESLAEIRLTLAKELDFGYPTWAMEHAITTLTIIDQAQKAGNRDTTLSLLRLALKSEASAQRGAAAWALGQLGDKEAIASLKQALRREKYACFVAQRMKEALTAIKQATGSN